MRQIFTEGSEEFWDFELIITYANEERDYTHAIFLATPKESKKKALDRIQKIVRKTRMRYQSMYMTIAPFMLNDQNYLALNGDRMLRMRYRYSNGQTRTVARLLKCQNADNVFVEGYGREAQTKLSS